MATYRPVSYICIIGDEKMLHTNQNNTHPVVCLRETSEALASGPTFLGAPLEGLHACIFLILGEKRIIHSYTVLLSKSSASALLSKAPLQKLSCAGTLFSKVPPTTTAI